MSMHTRAGTMLVCLTLVMALLGMSMHPLAFAHDAISSDARKTYLAKLDELQRAASSGSTAARTQALIDTGKLLDEIRGLLNEDIISHGKIQGLETTMLVSQLNATPYKLQQSAQTRLIFADLRPWRDALALDPKGTHAALARYRLMKNHFYDSFVDHPLKPLRQSKETLLEMIGFGESLMTAKDPAIDSEEVHFILGIHYLQALESGALPQSKCQSRVAEIQKKFRSQWPTSLKLATLEALSAP